MKSTTVIPKLKAVKPNTAKSFSSYANITTEQLGQNSL